MLDSSGATNALDIHKILIVAPSWVGDMVMAQSLLQMLTEKRPTCRIDVLAPTYLEPLLSRMPKVHKFIASPFQHGELNLQKRWHLAKQLQAADYQEAIVLPNSYKSALIPYFARIPRRVGYRGEWRYGVLNQLKQLDAVQTPRMVDQFVKLGLMHDEPLPTSLPDPELVAKVIPQKFWNQLQFDGNNLDKPAVILCPGAEYGPAKRWPSVYFGRLASKCMELGYQVWVVGGKKDSVVAAEILQVTNADVVDLTGKTSLDEVIDIMALATHVVTNDSGLMHIASALSRHVIVIYGSSSPEFTPPLTEHADIIRLSLPCSPCFERTCRLSHMNCLWQITPELVTMHIPEALCAS